MKISEILKTTSPSFSFEFFPPKTDEDVQQLMQTAASLRALNPTYISVTWGAGGSTRRKTIETVCAIKKSLSVEVMAHLTCVGSSRQDIDLILKELHENGIENILALRGDPPKGDDSFKPHPDGFRYASELIAHIRKRWNFCIGAAGYPEVHPESADPQTDINHLKRKVDAGADFITTQLFFDNAAYYRFADAARKAGIGVPLIPGIMPITNVGQVKRFTSLCGAKIPPDLLNRLDTLQNDKDAVIQLGIDYATQQCRELLRHGAPGIHFYTLNRSRSTTEILRHIQQR